jgi:hypothetical protein
VNIRDRPGKGRDGYSQKKRKELREGKGRVVVTDFNLRMLSALVDVITWFVEWSTQ